MSDLNEDVEHLKRAVATPGNFDAEFPNTTDFDLVGSLEDGFAEAQLYGFLLDHVLDLGTNSVAPDLSAAQRALVVLFSSSTILANALANRSSHVRYEASGAVFEQDTGASILQERLKHVQAQKKYLIEKGEDNDRYTDGLWMGDQAFVRAVADYGYGSLSVAWSELDAFGA